MTAEAHFRFATDIIRRLGEELNPSIDQSILELVKNAYDADARTCTITLRSTDKPGGSVIISDTGDGMDLGAIRDGWLVLGSSTKSGREVTRLGRISAGSKGLGRLAALRLGHTAELNTRPRDKKRAEYRVTLDWDRFDAATLVDEVRIPISSVPRTEPAPGTEIGIHKLRSAISRMDVKRLARALILLADPFGSDPEGFQPKLVAPEFADLAAKVATRYFDDADYHLVAASDRKGRASARVLDWKNQELFAASHKHLTGSRGDDPYTCPPTQFDLWVYLLSTQAFLGRSTTLAEVRSWLDAVGGVHLYLNGLRVSPYGNPGNDWLDINLRRAQSPEERPSTNTLIGRIAVQDKAQVLVQKTDRSGFIEGEAFHELRRFAQDAMEWMARRRMEVAEKRRQTERTSAPRQVERAKERVARAIESAPKAVQQALQRSFGDYDRLKEKEVENLRREVQLYRTLSTAGITAATFAHESSGNPIKVILQSAKSIERRAKAELGERYNSLLERPVDGILQSVDSLGALNATTLSLIDHDKRRVGRVDVHLVITRVFDMFSPFLSGRDVRWTLELAQFTPFLRGSEAAVESIITNLLNNSLAAFEWAGTAIRKIRVRTDIISSLMTLRISDSGPGIDGVSTKDIWLPGVTTRPNGTGLGLTIVRDATLDMGGNVDAMEHCDLGGAEIVVELPILGS